MAKSQCFNIRSKNKHRQNKKQINEGRLHLSMRRAEHQDIDELAVMSRSCYSYLLRWQGPLFHNRKRWRLLLDTECCEAWVCSSHGQIIGYFTIILDRQQYDEADVKHHPGLFVRLYMLGVCPKLFVTIALRKLKRRIHRSLRQLFGSSSDDDLTSCAAPSAPRSSLLTAAIQLMFDTGPEPIVLAIVSPSPAYRSSKVS